MQLNCSRFAGARGYTGLSSDGFRALRKGQQGSRRRRSQAMPYTCCGSLGAFRLGRGDFERLRCLGDLFGFLNFMDVLVGNLPAEVTPLPALLHVLFEEDRTARIRREGARGGEKYITHAILHSDFAAQKLSE